MSTISPASRLASHVRANRRGILLFLTTLAALAAITFVRAAPLLNYSHYTVDEPRIFARALGFLEYDFNPHWFGYHTLPMYVLSAFYFAIYLFQWALGLVADKTEFAATLYHDEGVLVVTARLVFGFAQTLGSYVLARIIYRELRSALGAVAFFLLSSLILDSYMAATTVRVDTFVFLFMALTVYWSVFASKSPASFFLAVASCSAALASKIPAATMFFPLTLVLLVDIWRRRYPLKYLLFYALSAPALFVLFMPYAVLDFESFSDLVKRMLFRASEGSFKKLGVAYRDTTAAKIGAIVGTVRLHVGPLVIYLAAVGAAALSLVDRKWLIALLYPLFFAGAFVTSSNLDSYWLRPVYPFVLFYAVAFVVWCGQRLRATNISARGRRRSSRLSLGFIALLLAVITLQLGLLGLLTVDKIARGARNTKVDGRVRASEWIQENVPEGSTIIMTGMQSYLPRVYSHRSKKDTLTNTYLDEHQEIAHNELLRKAFDHYYQRFEDRYREYKVVVLPRYGSKKLPKGAYVVIANTWYKRFYGKTAARSHKKFKGRIKKLRRFYDKIKDQLLVAEFVTGGRVISIYKVDPDAKRKKKRKKKAKYTGKPIHGARWTASKIPAPSDLQVFLSSHERLRALREDVRAGELEDNPVLARIRQKADASLLQAPISVVHKDRTPPSGDKRDYVSLGLYWWPNPKTESGLPYVKKDGLRNKAAFGKDYDTIRTSKMARTVHALALAAWLFDEPRYAERAALMLRVFYLDEATRMNPHLEYAQSIPGVVDGRGIGIIDNVCFTKVVDAIGFLVSLGALTEEETIGLKEWFSKYLHWLRTSKKAWDEYANKAHNNHGSYFDVQAMSIGLFVGERDFVKSMAETAGKRRIARQITPEGRQPSELKRTKSFYYSNYNLTALFLIAELAERVGTDLWRYESEKGSSLRGAVRYLTPFIDPDNDDDWKYKELAPLEKHRHMLWSTLRTAADKYEDAKLRTITETHTASARRTLSQLLETYNNK